MNTFIKPLTIVMALTIPALASASVDSNQLAENQVRITYNSHDATTEHGRVELVQEVRLAAEKVCGAQEMSKSRSLSELKENRNCFDKVVGDTLAQLGLELHLES